jgi:hypothetical protein
METGTRADAEADMSNDVIVGWRAVTGVNTRNTHETLDGKTAICGAEIVLTEAIIAATPRAFPPAMIKRLRSRPMCGACKRTREAKERVRGFRATRLRIEALEAALREIESDPAAPSHIREMAAAAVVR